MALKQLEGHDGVAVYVDPREVKCLVPSTPGDCTFVLLDTAQWRGFRVKGTPTQVHDALFVTIINP